VSNGNCKLQSFFLLPTTCLDVPRDFLTVRNHDDELAELLGLWDKPGVLFVRISTTRLPQSFATDLLRDSLGVHPASTFTEWHLELPSTSSVNDIA